MNIEIYQYAETDSLAWDKLIDNSYNGSFIFKRNYIEYHKKKFNEISMVFKQKNSGEILAIFPCNLNENSAISYEGLSFGGLVYRSDLKYTDINLCFDMIINHLKTRGVNQLIYKSMPYIFRAAPSQEDLYILHKNGANLYRRDLSSVIDTGAKLNFSTMRNRGIRKAESNHIRIYEGNFLGDFYKILVESLRMHSVKPTHKFHELDYLMKIFPKNIRLFGAFSGEELAAAVLIYCYHNAAHAQYITTSQIGKDTGALDLLFSYLLKSAFNNLDYFSFGISTENNGDKINLGLIHQKEGFGGRGLVYDSYILYLK